MPGTNAMWKGGREGESKEGRNLSCVMIESKLELDD